MAPFSLHSRIAVQNSHVSPSIPSEIGPRQVENAASQGTETDRTNPYYALASKRHSASSILTSLPKEGPVQSYEEIIQEREGHSQAVNAYVQEYKGNPDALAEQQRSLQKGYPEKLRAVKDAITQIRNSLREELIEKHTGDGQLDHLLRGMNYLIALRLGTPEAQPHTLVAIDEAMQDLRSKTEEKLVERGPNNPRAIHERKEKLLSDPSYPAFSLENAKYFEQAFENAEARAMERLRDNLSGQFDPSTGKFSKDVAGHGFKLPAEEQDPWVLMAMRDIIV